MSNSQRDQPPPNYYHFNHATHTFSHPPSGPQIFSYCIILSEIVCYYVCIHHIINNWVLFGLYTFSALLVVASTFITSISDPTDKIVYNYKWSKYKNEAFVEGISTYYFCEYCDSYCQQKSKHCRVCNRCVDNFDHHCIWINNCIGERNYKEFIVMISTTFIHIGIFLLGGGIMSHYVIITNVQHLKRAIPIWILMVILGILGILLLNLMILHLYLWYRGLTTYEFLLERKRKDEEDIDKKRTQAKVRQSEAEQSHAKIQIKACKNINLKSDRAKPVFDEEVESGQTIKSESNVKKGLKFMIGSSEVDRPSQRYAHESN